MKGNVELEDIAKAFGLEEELRETIDFISQDLQDSQQASEDS